MQNASHLLMIRPVGFSFNPETAVNNTFQQNSEGNLQNAALNEFNTLVRLFDDHDIDVTVIEDTQYPPTPDSIFPNNWISFHDTGEVILYPMFAINRRLERKESVLDVIKEKFNVRNVIDFSLHENAGLYLEGTGSMVLDRENKIAYCALSPRTHRQLIKEFCKMMSFTSVVFSARDRIGTLVYHTNVMMCVGDRFAIVCLESIQDEDERERLGEWLRKTGKEIIEINFAQLESFAGNSLQVLNRHGQQFLVMSSRAFHALTLDQVKKLEHYNQILHAPIDNIENAGGGSARCMIAEVFLSPK